MMPIKLLQQTPRVIFFTVLTFGLSSSSLLAQHLPPPIGAETKGEPATLGSVAEEIDSSDEAAISPAISKELETEPDVENRSGIDTLLGTATITESKRENGRVYRIELEHSSGSKQYIEESDSDGKIESTSNDIEETPNLPKWRLGSW